MSSLGEKKASDAGEKCFEVKKGVMEKVREEKKNLVKETPLKEGEGIFPAKESIKQPNHHM